jgi:hypothetical protein
MKKLALALAFVAALCFSALTATAKGHSGSHGKPSQNGVEHAETVANPKGVQHGIDNAETKQSLHKGSLKTTSKTKGKYKHQKHQGAAH